MRWVRERVEIGKFWAPSPCFLHSIVFFLFLRILQDQLQAPGSSEQGRASSALTKLSLLIGLPEGWEGLEGPGPALSQALDEAEEGCTVAN